MGMGWVKSAVANKPEWQKEIIFMGGHAGFYMVSFVVAFPMFYSFYYAFGLIFTVMMLTIWNASNDYQN